MTDPGRRVLRGSRRSEGDPWDLLVAANPIAFRRDGDSRLPILVQDPGPSFRILPFALTGRTRSGRSGGEECMVR